MEAKVDIPALIKEVQKGESLSEALLQSVKQVSTHVSQYDALALYNLALSIAEKGNVFQSYLKSDIANPCVDILLQLKNQPTQLKHTRLMEWLKVYTNPQTHFVIIQQLLHTLPHAVVDYSILLPTILRTIGIILHQYLNIKKEKASSDKDKLQSEIILEQHCQHWTQDTLIKLSSAVGNILESNESARRYFLNYSFDVIEALLQNKLEGVFRSEVLQPILNSVETQLLKHYSAVQITRLYTDLLKSNRFKVQGKHLQVPEQYHPNMVLNSSGYSYCISRFAKAKYFYHFHSVSAALEVLSAATGESFRKGYPHRQELLTQLGNLLSRVEQFDYKSVCEYGYPLSLLINQLLQQEDTKCKQIIERIKFTPRLAVSMLEVGRTSRSVVYINDKLALEVQKLQGFKGLINRLQKQGKLDERVAAKLKSA